MKQRLLTIFFTLLPLLASAEAVEIDGIYYNLVPKGRVAEVTSNPTFYSGNVEIPDKVVYEDTEYDVTIIGDNAFSGCGSLTSITIPFSVTSIGGGAFYDCNSLNSVHISDIATWCNISFHGEYSNPLSYAHHLFINGEKIIDLVIPNTVSSIAQYAFCGYSDMASITIPSSITSIGYEAFYGCNGLTSVHISDITAWCNIKFSHSSHFGDNPLTYAHHLFINNEKVKELIIPNSVTIIKNGAFAGCDDLTSVTIPSSVTVIGEYVFEFCSSLTSVTIGNSVTSIGGYAFSGCSSLTSVTIGNSVTSIGDYAFCGCESLLSIIIPNSVTSIGNSTFSGCSSLTSVTIPNSVTSIGNSTFSSCSSLTSVTFGNSVASIADYAFWGCNSLISVTIPNYVTTIGNSAFKNCSNLTTVSIGSNMSNIRNNAFSGCKELSDVICYAENVPEAAYDAFQGSYIEYATLHVPQTSVDLYKSETPWNDFGKIKAIGETLNIYKLTYLVDGVEYKTYEIEEGAKITPKVAPTKEGYTFSGWSEIPETMPAHDVTVTGSFIINKYNLTYIVDGEKYKSIEVDYSSSITPEADPTKDGYNFSGWSEIPETMPAHDVTITGTFIINKYKLIYMVDSEEYKSFEIEYNSSITPEADPTKDGYTFSGWSEIPETMPAHDVTITGSFERVYSGGDVANLINLLLFGDVDDEDIALYDMNGDGELNIGDLILIMRAAQQNSRNRSAANRAAENQTIEFAADNITMKPGETSALNISLSSSISGIYGIQFEVNLPEGFSLEKDSNDKIYEMSANQVDDITCNNHDLGNGTYRFFIYSSTLQELKGGSLMSLNLKADADKTLGNYSVSISNVALSDYDGHVTKEDGMSVGVKVTNSFTLLYQVDGEDYKSYEIECGESITPETEPTKEGYTFSGWSEIPETMPAEDVIVTGTFTVKQYILTYVVDGAVYKEYCYDYGSTIAPETEPTKEGYTFSGWSEIPETMPANEVYVVGKFTINKYKITYVIDGVVFKTEEVEYGSTITPPNPGDHEGYDFAWEDYPTTMPAEDILIQGTYTPTGIEAILASEPDVKIFTVSGKPLNKLQKGVNILRYKDGRTRKIVVK